MIFVATSERATETEHLMKLYSKSWVGGVTEPSTSSERGARPMTKGIPDTGDIER
jgi:hypothetical protein